MPCFLCACQPDWEQKDSSSGIEEVSVERLLTGVFQHSTTWVTPGYDRYFGWGSYIGARAQVFGFPKTPDMYLPDAYGDHLAARWDDFYRSLATFRVLRQQFDALSPDPLSDEGQTAKAPFLWLAQLFIYHQLAEVTGAWGDVPYSQAGYLFLNGQPQHSEPHFDSQQALYTMMLDSLAVLDSCLRKYNPAHYPAVRQALSVQDYLLAGDLLLWRQLANALRLRLAIRLSSSKALAGKAQDVVNELLSYPARYPLPEADLAFYSSKGPDLKWEVLGVNDPNRYHGYAAHAHIGRMVEDDDPRLTVVYDPAWLSGNYVGLDPSLPYDALTDKEQNLRLHYSSIDSSSFRKANDALPGLLFTQAELCFLRAEAYARGLASGDAQQAFTQGVIASVHFYWRINRGSSFRPETEPEGLDTQAQDFALARWQAIGSDYGSEMEAIITQKWIHLGFLQEFEAWCEVRRTGFPPLHQPQDLASLYPNPPQRLRYPDQERLYNRWCPKLEDDRWETPLIWATHFEK